MTKEIKVGDTRITGNGQLFTIQSIYKDRCIIEFEDGHTDSGTIFYILEWSKPNKKPFKLEVLRYVSEIQQDADCFIGFDYDSWRAGYDTNKPIKIKITVEEIIE